MAKIKLYRDASHVIKEAGETLLEQHSRMGSIPIDRWQGMDLKGVEMIESLGESYKFQMPQHREELAEKTMADLPWAENHFQERVAGIPTNPGDTFRDWPYYKEGSYRRGGEFTHTYQERFWPKYTQKWSKNNSVLQGVRFPYGDYMDVVNLLSRDPLTRQAFLPIWFPEDTGVVHGGRVPCTLGYLFTYRNGYLHMTYYIRSCDYIRHFKNDIYMAIRLAQHTLDSLNLVKSKFDWGSVPLGMFTMHIESLHIFKTDIIELKKRLK